MSSPDQTSPILALTATFIAERRYLQNVSPKTLEWYRCSFKAFEPYLATACGEHDLRALVRKAVMEMSEAGRLSPTSINDYARCLNAFLKWLKDEGHIAQAIKIPKVKAERKLPVLLSDGSIAALVRYKPRNRIERRVHTMCLVVLDTAMRVDEVRHLRKRDVDFDNLILTVRKAKGGKQRVLPFSLALRRVLFQFMKTEPHRLSEYVFSTKDGAAQTYRNAHRVLKSIGGAIGIPMVRFHLLRHQWATNYLRTGGSVAYLRRLLGHSAYDTVLLYEHLDSSDLSACHDRHSLLSNCSG